MIVVIGATGFIGMYTVRHFLEKEEKVIAAGRSSSLGKVLTEMGAEFVQLNLTNEADFEKLPKENVDGVVLLAGLLPANVALQDSQSEPAADYFKINVIGAIHALEYCRRSGIKKIINCTSYADVKNRWTGDRALTEEEPRSFSFSGDHALYIISKNAISDVMEYYNEAYDMNCAWFRLPPVYGVGPHGFIYVNGKLYHSGIDTFIERAKKGEPIEIWGDPNLRRDIVYVKDVARAFDLALHHDNVRGLFNMTSSHPVSLEEQVKVIIDLFGNPECPSPIVYRPDKPNNTSSFWFSMDKADKAFGFVPEYKDFRTMMEDYKKELESGRWESLQQTRSKQQKMEHAEYEKQ